MYINFLPVVALGLLVVWILLALQVRKKKTNLFLDQVEPKSAERRLRTLKAFLLVAGISFVVFIVGVFLHNALSALFGREESVSFFIALLSLAVFTTATIGGLVIFLKGRRETRQRKHA